VDPLIINLEETEEGSDWMTGQSHLSKWGINK
jgi:hypothetical protein